MPDVVSVLRAEIRRLSRKEIRTEIEPLKKRLHDLRQSMARQKKQLVELEKTQAQVSKAGNTDRGPAASAAPEKRVQAARITATSIKKHRKRLNLSQREMGLLLKVSTMTITRWEQGKASPRGKNRTAFLELRGMGVRQVKKMLEEEEEEEKKKKKEKKEK